MAATYCDSCGNWGGHSEHCERHPDNMAKKKYLQTADTLRMLRMAEMMSFPKDMKNDLISLGISQERAEDFMYVMLASKPYSIMNILRQYGDEFIPEIILLMNHYNKG